jgi:hypothetical protein
MNISKPGKIALLAATLVPIVYAVLFIGGVVVMAATSFQRRAPSEKPNLGLFAIIFGMHLGVMLLSMVLICFYIIYLFKTERVENDKKALWAVVLFLGGFIAMPIFWYLYIWRESVGTPGAEGLVPEGRAPGGPEISIDGPHRARRDDDHFGRGQRRHGGSVGGGTDDE